MKVLALLGSPRKNGNTAALLDEYLKGIREAHAGAQIETVFLPGKNIHCCTGCNACHSVTPNVCAIKDDMQQISEQYAAADLVVYASPVYWWGVSAQFKAFLDRTNAFDGLYGKYFHGKSLSVLMTYGGELPNEGPALVKATFKEICAYTGMKLADVYGACAAGMAHIREDEAAMRQAYELGRKFTL